jgi:hypothetical protein
MKVATCAIVRYAVNPKMLKASSMNYQVSTFVAESHQEKLERHLLESATLDNEQLSVAKRLQARQEGPLLMILLQLSFIDIKQFSRLLDWTVRTKLDSF